MISAQVIIMVPTEMVFNFIKMGFSISWLFVCVKLVTKSANALMGFFHLALLFTKAVDRWASERIREIQLVFSRGGLLISLREVCDFREREVGSGFQVLLISYLYGLFVEATAMTK